MKKEKGASTSLLAVVTLGEAVVVAAAVELFPVEAGAKNVPIVSVKNCSKRLSLVSVITGAARARRVELFSNDNTAAWNQEAPTLHMSGPPESL